jgi:hypothetical protein
MNAPYRQRLNNRSLFCGQQALFVVDCADFGGGHGS